MPPPQPASGLLSFGRLREFARPRPPVERCDLCAREVGPRHDHLMEPAARRLLCACGACAVLFSNQSAPRYRRVPRRVRMLEDFRLTDAQWDGLRLPIQLAFFFHSTPQQRMVACYPSPAGATESLLHLDTWDEIVAANPILATMEPDVEMLLANRVGAARGSGPAEHYLAPADWCFRLVGLIRLGWKGLSGGNAVWKDIGAFFDELKRQAGAAPGARDA
jgi:uncharacterized protein DUF5947